MHRFSLYNDWFGRNTEVIVASVHLHLFCIYSIQFFILHPKPDPCSVHMSSLTHTQSHLSIQICLVFRHIQIRIHNWNNMWHPSVAKYCHTFKCDIILSTLCSVCIVVLFHIECYRRLNSLEQETPLFRKAKSKERKYNAWKNFGAEYKVFRVFSDVFNVCVCRANTELTSECCVIRHPMGAKPNAGHSCGQLNFPFYFFSRS